MSRETSYRDWHIPYHCDQLTLREARASLELLGAKQEDIPLMVQLVENPRFDLPGFDIFHGAVDIATHDCIHILLGRGLLPKDEAFVIGFTMGSTNRVTALEEHLYALISKYLYPRAYQFRDDEIRIFKDAVRLGYISDCQPLDTVPYAELLDERLCDLRRRVGLEDDLLLAYYGIEQRRHPKSRASRRLLPPSPQAPA